MAAAAHAGGAGRGEGPVPAADELLDWEALAPADRERVLGLAFMRLRARR